MYLVLAASTLVGEAVGTPLLHLTDVTAEGAVHLDGVGRGLPRPTGSDVAHRGLVGDADPGGFSGVRGDGDAYLVTGSDVGGVRGLSKVVAAPRQDR